LSHLSKGGWLGVVRSVAGERRVVVPDAVQDELKQGVHAHPHLRQVIDADWIIRAELSSDPELTSFAGFAAKLVVGRRNVGEAAVLAYAQAHDATAVIDDGAGRKAAVNAGVAVRGTLALLCEAIREDVLTVRMVGDLADHLLETEYRLPFRAGGFERWANETGLV
jgi:predicted nucleic acid-binding protein